jgi:DnaK suppressor protein
MDELTDEQVATLTARLHALRAELRRTLETASDRTAPVELTTAQGRVSRMDAMQQQQMALAERRRHEVRLSGIDAALERIAHDEYGWCTRCGESIGLRRLEVRPEGPLCMGCTRALGG